VKSCLLLSDTDEGQEMVRFKEKCQKSYINVQIYEFSPQRSGIPSHLVVLPPHFF
jgi:hypothetical protein